VFRRPDEVGLEYGDVFFPSMAGVPLDGWFIPADSDRLIIHNHFMPGNRYDLRNHGLSGTGKWRHRRDRPARVPGRDRFDSLDEQSPIGHATAVTLPLRQHPERMLEWFHRRMT
jgi:hypothetical protein